MCSKRQAGQGWAASPWALGSPTGEMSRHAMSLSSCSRPFSSSEPSPTSRYTSVLPPTASTSCEGLAAATVTRPSAPGSHRAASCWLWQSMRRADVAVTCTNWSCSVLAQHSVCTRGRFTSDVRVCGWAGRIASGCTAGQARGTSYGKQGCMSCSQPLGLNTAGASAAPGAVRQQHPANSPAQSRQSQGCPPHPARQLHRHGRRADSGRA
jgi:hypothetical protein